MRCFPRLHLLAGVIAVQALAGCAVGREIAQEEAIKDCRKAVWWEDQRSCEQQVRQTYSGYEQKREALSGSTAAEPARPRAEALCFTRQSTGERVCPN